MSTDECLPPVAPCAEPNCDRPRMARGLCQYHYNKHRRQGGFAGVPECGTAGCHRPTVARGFCGACYQRLTYAGAFGKERRDAARRYQRAAGLKRWRNMTQEEFERRLAQQGGVCANPGCGGQPPPGQQWQIDHDHQCCPDSRKPSCGACTVAILCPKCNRAVQSHDLEWLRGLVAYLEKWHRPRFFEAG